MMDETQLERLIEAAESIAESFVALYKLEAARFDKEFPVKRNPLDVPDATITHLPTAEEDLQATQGATGEETTDEWIGLREQAVLDERAKELPAKPRSTAKRVPAKKTARK